MFTSRGVNGVSWVGADGEGVFLGIFWKLPGNFPESWGSLGLQSDTLCIAQRQNKILIHGLHQNDPAIMPDSSVEYSI